MGGDVADRYAMQFVTIHGHRRAYVRAGSGPVVLLLHGLGCDHTTWDPVIESLSRRYTVIAPDLLGHGRSDKPRADYSVGGYANGMRDLLTVLGIDKVAAVFDRFKGPAARHAIRHVVRAVVDWHGQIVTMADRDYLTEEMPMWVVWGRDDRVIPVRHANIAAALAPRSRVEVIPDAGHFPHKDHPYRFSRIVHEFIRNTEPAKYSRARFRALLKDGGESTAPAPLRAVADI